MMTSRDLFARVEPLRFEHPDRLLKACAAFLGVIVLWSVFFSIDEQTRTTGSVIASSRSQVIQVVDGGTLQVLHVKEGDSVKAGTLLAELDPVRFQASNDEIDAKVMSLHANILRLEAEINGRPLVLDGKFTKYPELVSGQQDLLRKRREAQREEVAGLMVSARLAKKELDSLLRLRKNGDASEAEILRSQRQVNDLTTQANNKQNGYRQEAQAELAKSRAEFEQAEQVFSQRSNALASTQLRAPMDGIVKNVRVTTRGAVLKAGDELMQIVPSNDPLIIEAKVRSQDVAFLRVGLPANVKLDAYDYTIYGSLPGRVIYISPDTLEVDLARDEKPYYRVHIQTQGQVTTAGRSLDVRPGMTVTSEIITGERTLAAFVLKPLRRGLDSALHER